MTEEVRTRRIVLAGPTKSIALLRQSLPARIDALVAGVVSGARHESGALIAERAVELLAHLEGQRVAAEVDATLVRAAKRADAAAGVEDALDAVNRGAVRRLYVHEAFRERGQACAACGALARGEVTRCARCGARTVGVDLDAAMVARVIGPRRGGVGGAAPRPGRARWYRRRAAVPAVNGRAKFRAMEADVAHMRPVPPLAELLAEHWWMLAVRGGLALALGVTLVAWPHAMLDRVIVVFGAYALLDGLWAVGSAARLSRGGFATWPVALEGVASIALAGITLGWPLVPRDIVRLIGAWGIVTGVLEIAWAGRLPAERAFRWLLVTGGVCSIFLAGVVLVLPYAYGDAVVWALAAYAGLFGLAILAAAWRSRRGLPTARHARSESTPRLGSRRRRATHA